MAAWDSALWGKGGWGEVSLEPSLHLRAAPLLQQGPGFVTELEGAALAGLGQARGCSLG